MEKLSERLEKITGWSVVPVAGLVPDGIFFNHLANERFPAGAFIRSEQELNYLEEPDIFHNIFGHVPLLAHPIYSDFMQALARVASDRYSLASYPIWRGSTARRSNSG
jgi:phenylalanine-4-hydroxylase